MTGAFVTTVAVPVRGPDAPVVVTTCAWAGSAALRARNSESEKQQDFRTKVVSTGGISATVKLSRGQRTLYAAQSLWQLQKVVLLYPR